MLRSYEIMCRNDASPAQAYHPVAVTYGFLLVLLNKNIEQIYRPKIKYGFYKCTRPSDYEKTFMIGSQI